MLCGKLLVNVHGWPLDWTMLSDLIFVPPFSHSQNNICLHFFIYILCVHYDYELWLCEHAHDRLLTKSEFVLFIFHFSMHFQCESMSPRSSAFNWTEHEFKHTLIVLQIDWYVVNLRSLVQLYALIVADSLMSEFNSYEPKNIDLNVMIIFQVLVQQLVLECMCWWERLHGSMQDRLWPFLFWLLD